MNEYTLYFNTGAKTKLVGESQEKAFKNAQLSDSAIEHLEMVRIGDNTDYTWNAQRKAWDRKTQMQ